METAAKYEVMAPVLDLADVKKYIAPNATDKELYMFMNISKAYGLNPFKREVHFIKYGTNPGQVVVGYETFLKRAEASGQLDGWGVVILDRGTPNERAVITIHRKDRTQPFIWEVSRREFDKGQSTWKLMPEFMLKKVAISQGMRLCFAEQLGGMPYSPEEINGKRSEELPKVEPDEQPEPVSPPVAAPEDLPEEEPQKGMITKEQKNELYEKMKEAKLSKEQSKEFFYWFNGRDNMTSREANLFIEKFDGHLKKFQEQVLGAGE